MDSDQRTRLRVRVAGIWRQACDWVLKLSLTARVMLGLFLFAALLVALHTALSTKDARLHLTVQHSFRSADISLWVDDDLAYSGKLTGSIKKKFGLIASGSSWFAHYASALFLTIGGSIVSAITGFALRELPGHIRSRQDSAVKAQSASAGQ